MSFFPYGNMGSERLKSLTDGYNLNTTKVFPVTYLVYLSEVSLFIPYGTHYIYVTDNQLKMRTNTKTYYMYKAF